MIRDIWLKVPDFGDGQADESFQPKYSFKVKKFGGIRCAKEESEPYWIAHFYGTEKILNEILQQSDVSLLSEIEVENSLNDMTGKNYTFKQWNKKI